MKPTSQKKAASAPVSSTITSTQIDECTKLVVQAKAILGTNIVSLSAVDRNRRSKAKRGGENQISVIASLATANNLQPPQHSVTELQSGYDAIKALKPLLAEISVLLKIIEDALLTTQSDTWQVATLFYSMLKPLAARDPNVAKALEPVTEFFRPKKGTKKSADGTAAATKDSTVSTDTTAAAAQTATGTNSTSAHS